MKKPEKKKEGAKTDTPENTDPNEHGEIKSDYPISEKDEVKAVEEKMRKDAKKRKKNA